MKKILLATFASTLFFACGNEKQKEIIETVIVTEVNPASEDFNAESSDVKAIEIADKVMLNMGGRKAWDETKIIKWNFFGARSLTWNKHSGDVKIQFGETDSNIFITNIFTHKGKIKLDGVVQTVPDSIEKFTEMAESVWINDAYWLFMPFKLKDSKATLKYLAIDTVLGGSYSHKLQLTFNEIGDTPENKYWVYVDTTSMLVNQWAYFASNSDSLPRFTTPWADYNKYGDILLSGDRGKRQITAIEVLDSLPANYFITF